MLLTPAMTMFAFKFILVIKCSIIINEKEKKTLSLMWLLHLAPSHNSKCRIYNLFFFTFTRVGFETTNSNKMDNENQWKNQKKKKKRKEEKKKEVKQEEIP